MELNFEKLGNNRYKIILTDEVLDKINNIVKYLSLDKPEDYSDINNESLRDNLLARYVASHFFKSNNGLGELGFSILDIYYNKKLLHVSVGKIQETNDKLKNLAGVIYI